MRRIAASAFDGAWGLDGSEQRLCEYRCLPLWDDMNNWVADKPTPPKFVQAISEVYSQNYGDDIYANNPVNYVRLDSPAAAGRMGADYRCHGTRRLFRDFGRGAHTALCGGRERGEAHGYSRCGMDISA